MKKNRIIAIAVGVLSLAIAGSMTYAWFVQNLSEGDEATVIQANELDVVHNIAIESPVEDAWAGDIISPTGWSVMNRGTRTVVVKLDIAGITGVDGNGADLSADRISKILELTFDPDAAFENDVSLIFKLDDAVIEEIKDDYGVDYSNSYFMRVAPDESITGENVLKFRLTSDFGGNHMGYINEEGKLISEGWSGGDDYANEQGSVFEFNVEAIALQNTYGAVSEHWTPVVADLFEAKDPNNWG